MTRQITKVACLGFMLALLVACRPAPQVDDVVLPGYAVQFRGFWARADLSSVDARTGHELNLKVVVVDRISRAPSLRTECTDLRIILDELTDDEGSDLLPYRTTKDEVVWRHPPEDGKPPRLEAAIRLENMPSLPARLATVRGRVELFLPSDVAVYTVSRERSVTTEVTPGLEFEVGGTIDRGGEHELICRYRSRLFGGSDHVDSLRLYAIELLDHRHEVIRRERVTSRGGVRHAGWIKGTSSIRLPSEAEVVAVRLIVVTCRETVAIPFEWKHVEILVPS